MADEATDNFTPTEWINLAPSPASVDGRRNATNAFCKANGVEGIDSLVEKINISQRARIERTYRTRHNRMRQTGAPRQTAVGLFLPVSKS